MHSVLRCVLRCVLHGVEEPVACVFRLFDVPFIFSSEVCAHVTDTAVTELSHQYTTVAVSNKVCRNSVHTMHYTVCTLYAPHGKPVRRAVLIKFAVLHWSLRCWLRCWLRLVITFDCNVSSLFFLVTCKPPPGGSQYRRQRNDLSNLVCQSYGNFQRSEGSETLSWS